MTFRGVYRDGVIILDDGAVLREGTVVRVVKLPAARTKRPAQPRPAKRGKPASKQPVAPRSARPARGWLLEVLAPHIGALKGLPRDAAEQHDHYLYGTPKRRR